MIFSRYAGNFGFTAEELGLAIRSSENPTVATQETVAEAMGRKPGVLTAVKPPPPPVIIDTEVIGVDDPRHPEHERWVAELTGGERPVWLVPAVLTGSIAVLGALLLLRR